MNPKLSIIIPCYNSATTLPQAVASCFTQEMDISSFEIIIVDDGSSDNTTAVIKSLETTYSNIKFLSHENNLGGGAARNTGINASVGEIIYCLDSDNFFAPNSVKTMLNFLQEQQVDGVAYYERRFFYKKNATKYQSKFNHKQSRINIEDIFSLTNNILLDNFFYTRAAFNKTPGYPNDHGFDTQCFELRFLSVGNSILVVPNSVFYHRQDTGHNSYFQRVYKQGHLSRNFYLICEDIIHLLSIETRELIMNFDIFGESKLNSENLKAVLDIRFKTSPENFFIEQKEMYMTPNGSELFLHSIISSNEPADLFARAIIDSKRKDYTSSLNTLMNLLASGTDSQIIYFNLLRTELNITNKYARHKIIDEVARVVASMSPRPQTISRLAKFLIRFQLKKI